MTSIVDAMRDERLFGRWFADPSWRPWKVALAALFGLLASLHITEEDLELYKRCTGRTTLPTVPAREGWFIVGRRLGR